MKMKEKEKNRARLCIFYIYIYIYIFIYLYSVGLHDSLRTSSRELYIKKNYKTKYLRLFNPFPNLITKESYNWWVTRRRMEIYTKISEEKYPKVSVATIGKLQENTRALFKMAAKFSQQKADFAAMQKSSFSLE